MNKLQRVDEISFRQAIESSSSISEALARLKLPPISTYYRSLRQRCQDLNLQPPSGWQSGRSAKKLDDLLVKSSTITTSHLKKRLITEGVLKEVCDFSDCPTRTLDLWRNMKLVLQLDHINGDRTDNRIENLRLLCPNCHSQTETWCGRKIVRVPKGKKTNTCSCGAKIRTTSASCRRCVPRKSHVSWPSNLSELVQKSNISRVARQLGCSHTSVRRRLLREANH